MTDRPAGRLPQRGEQVCDICGRRMPRGRPPQQRRCSQRCRRSRLTASDAALEAAIRTLLARRAAAATICPSEAAQLVFGGCDPEQMQRTRRAARRLVAAGELDILQGGRPVDPSTARGPIRLRRRAGGGGGR